MIRIAGVSVPGKKQARFALTSIRGIGKSKVKDILNQVNIDFNAYFDDLPEEKTVELRKYIEEKVVTESDLRRKQQSDIKHLVDVNSHRGLRHKVGLPVRGQTTKTNSRTRRGNKRLTGGSGKNKSAAKT